MTIVVTGATGGLGRHVVETLLTRGVPAGQIVAIGRRIEKIQDLADRGVNVQRADYDEPESLRKPFADADKVLLVSSSEPGKRIPQHQNVIDAAKAAGVSRIVYTSLPHALSSGMMLAADHIATEQALAASGLPFVVLRNGWYLENYDLKGALEHGLTGASGNGKISIATRADLAEAAAAALVADDLDKQVYELGGEGVTMAELATELSRQSGREVTYTNLSPDKYIEFLVGVGVPAGFAPVLADSDHHAATGALDTGTEDLARLLGRPATPLADAIRAQLA